MSGPKLTDDRRGLLGVDSPQRVATVDDEPIASLRLRAFKRDERHAVQLVDLGAGEDAGSSAGPMSSHGMDLPRVLRLARAMGHAPRRVVVVGIEGENFADGVGLSPAVALAVSEAGELVIRVIDEAASCA